MMLEKARKLSRIRERERNLRLATHRELITSGEVFVNRVDLLGDMGEGLFEELEALLLDFLEIASGAFGSAASVVEILIGSFEPVLNGFEPLHGPHVRGHMVKFVVELLDSFLQLVF